MKEEITATPAPETGPRPSLLRRLWRWTTRAVIVLFLLLLFLVGILHIPAVQNWAVSQVTSSLSQRLGSKVEVGYLYLKFFDELVLEDTYIEDIYGDTLLSTEYLGVDFSLNPLKLLRGQLYIEEVTLNNALLKQRREPGEALNTLALALNRLFPPKDHRNPNAFQIDLQQLTVNNIRYEKDDQVSGQHMLVKIPNGLINLHHMDLPNRLLQVRSVEIHRPVFRIDAFERDSSYDEMLAMQQDAVVKSLDSTLIDTLSLRISVDIFRLQDGQFSLHNARKAPIRLIPTDELDYAHLDVSNIDMSIDSFFYAKDTFAGRVNNINLQEAGGFVLQALSAKDIVVSPQETRLQDLYLQTPQSLLGDTLIFTYDGYSAFTDFNDKVKMYINLNQAALSLSDIMTFAPGLRSNLFFQNNRNEILTIDGLIRGEVNDLNANDLNIVLTGRNGYRNSQLRGNFSSHDLAVPGEEIMNLELESLSTDMRTLRQLIPNFDPPASFNRLGRLDFSGNFGGFFQSLFASGDLITDLGKARVDMNLTLNDRKADVTYGGSLDLIDFDLGAWSEDPNFGIANLSAQVKNGMGLTLETANADLTANINSLVYKNYSYENAALVGRLTKNFFQGDFAIQDDNIDLNFRGTLDFTDSIPKYDFAAQVRELSLQPLNLSRQDLVLAGNFDLNLRSRKITDIKGQAEINDFRLVLDGDRTYLMEHLDVRSFTTPAGIDSLRLRSDIGVADFSGHFDLQQIGNAFLGYLNEYHPGFSKRLKLARPEIDITTQDFDYYLNIFDTRGLLAIIDPRLGELEDVVLKGYFRGPEGRMLVDLDLPYFRYDNIKLQDIAARFDGEPQAGDLYFVVDSTLVNNNYLLSTIQLSSLIEGDSIDFTFIHTTGRTGLVEDLNLDGILYLPDSVNYEIRFKPSDLKILENSWSIDEDNYITFGKQYLDTRNFVMTNGQKQVRLRKEGERGLELSLENFDFGMIDDFWTYPLLDFDGFFDVRLLIGDVFAFKDFKAELIGDTLLINQYDFGLLRIDAATADLRSPANFNIQLTADTMQLMVKGNYNLANQQPDPRGLPLEQQARYFDAQVSIAGYPLSLAEFFIGTAVSEVDGYFNSQLRVNGLPTRPNIKGFLLAEHGAFTVNFLKTRYRFSSAYADIDNDMFDLTGTILYDKYHHRAVLFGGISHDHLRGFGFDARVRTNRFLGLDTRKGDNEMFYGHALGQGLVRFTGTFPQPNVYVNATVNDSSSLVIPVSSEREVSDLSYVRWRTPDEPETQDSRSDLRGISLEMDLIVREEAEMQIVFDELAGDIIRGSGRGNIRILVPRGGDFQMFGDYVIDRGNYLFTLYNVVNKDFKINRGGIIRWNGDPFEAQISLQAEYKDLKAPVANFIQEYLINASSTVRNDASQSTDVDLVLHLQGDLLQPVIDFSIVFPDLKGELQTYTDNKLRLLRQDQNELNRQVFGLIVVGQFLPSDLSFRGTDIIYNTVSEFVSNQLSLLLTELFSEVIGEGKVLSGIDFDIAYNQYRSVDFDNQISSGEELELSVTQNFFDDRLSIEVGGNVGFGTSLQASPESSGTFVGNDLVIEYILNPKLSTLKLRIYQRLQPDIGGGQRLQIGGGLSYRKEFNNFGEFWRSLTDKGRKMRK